MENHHQHYMVMTEIFDNEQMTTFSVITEKDYLFHNKIGNDRYFVIVTENSDRKLVMTEILVITLFQ